jgi:aminopeptidase N
VRRLVVAIAVLVASAAAAGVHHDVTVTLDPATRRLDVVDRVRSDADARATMPDGLTGVTVDGAVAPSGPIALAAGRTTTIAYRATLPPPSRDDGAARSFADPDGSFLAPGTWHARVDAPTFTWRVQTDVPAGQRAVAPGRLDAEDVGPDRVRATFVGDTPTEELPLFAGPYVVAERMHRGIRLRTWLHPDVVELADTYLEKTAGYLDLYAGWIGPYPFPGFDVVSSPLPVGLGFPGLTWIGRQVLRLPFIPDTSLGHEVLHCWWGNGVFVDPAQGNWAEGLTTFMADYTFVERRSADEARTMRLRWLREFAVLPAAQDVALATFRAKGHTASQVIGYHKAAMVFAMLRDTIGAAAFADGVRTFWTRHRFTAAGWRELEAAFVAAAGRPLDGFFAQWVTRAGAPVLGVRDARAAGTRVDVTLTQEAPTYALRVPVHVTTDAAPPAIADVALDGTAAAAQIDAKGTPRAVLVDPDFRVFRRLAPDEVPPILRTVAFDASTATVLVDLPQAARTVAASLLEGEPRVVETLPATGPVLVVGGTAAVNAWLARHGLPAAPPEVAGKGTAHAWATTAQGRPVVLVAGTDGDALAAAAGPLPHLAGESWVVFEGRRSIARGLWSPVDGGLRVLLVP